MSVVRGMPAESNRNSAVTWSTRFCRYSSMARVGASSSRWLEPWMIQYSSWTLRFHHVAGHGVGSSHGPQVAITGASRRAADATLYSWIQ
jgi:hypothetical protein